MIRPCLPSQAAHSSSTTHTRVSIFRLDLRSYTLEMLLYNGIPAACKTSNWKTIGYLPHLAPLQSLLPFAQANADLGLMRGRRQAEIVDETDIYEDVNARVPRQVAARVDLATFMMMFEHKLSHQQVLSSAEVQAVAAFLSLNVEQFSLLAHFELPLKVWAVRPL